MKQRLYIEPSIEIIYMAAERGFLVSSDQDWGLPGKNPTTNDYERITSRYMPAYNKIQGKIEKLMEKGE